MGCSTVSPGAPQVNVTGYKLVTPPTELLDDCEANRENTIGGVIEALSGLLRCEHDQNKALREWYEQAMHGGMT